MQITRKGKIIGGIIIGLITIVQGYYTYALTNRVRELESFVIAQTRLDELFLKFAISESKLNAVFAESIEKLAQTKKDK